MGTDKEQKKQQSPAALGRSAALGDMRAEQTCRVPVARNTASNQEATATIPQGIRVAFFFDGTGNNLDADVGNEEHSNVARLFRAHPQDDAGAGIFSHYVPGIATRFKDINDPGGEDRANAFGMRGGDRLTWAMSRLEERLSQSRGRTVHVALFGFSRGAALARAFAVRIAKRSERGNDGTWRMTHGNTRYPVRLYFMGLFDTVASVGVPMSTNNEPARGLSLNLLSLRQAMKNRSSYGNSLANIAFGDAPGADPASGSSNGHMDWGDDLHIPPMVENCLHMVAAHEIRNSFPLDSLLQGHRYPRGCREMVYPGAHSDVGGGYRRGEGARSDTPGSLLSLVPLRGMRLEAIRAGVPLMAELPTEKLKRDFAEDGASRTSFATLNQRFAHYMRVVDTSGQSVGATVLAHMRLYYQWRFHKLFRNLGARLDGRDIPEQTFLRRFEPGWAREDDQLSRSTESLRRQANTHQRNADALRGSALMMFADGQRRYAEESRLAAQKQDAYLSEKARLDTMPSSDGSFVTNSNIFDDQLLADARELQALVKKRGRGQLRPHYQAVLDAYEAELNGRGLKDPEIIAFFDTYVHDSLAAFGMDATLPSDPRVIYIGGDRKAEYAFNPPARQGLPTSSFG